MLHTFYGLEIVGRGDPGWVWNRRRSSVWGWEKLLPYLTLPIIIINVYNIFYYLQKGRKSTLKYPSLKF